MSDFGGQLSLPFFKNLSSSSEHQIRSGRNCMAKKSWKEIRRKKRCFWRAHIRAWEKSGLTQNEYCRQNKLRPNQLTYWKTKFTKEKSDQVRFVPVPVNINQVQSQLDNSDSGLSVHIGTLQVRINNNFNSSSLVKVVDLLQGRL